MTKDPCNTVVSDGQHSVVLINSNILEPKCVRIPVLIDKEVSQHVAS